jgi:predicted nuclease of predicted toxin-antitoxin system
MWLLDVNMPKKLAPLLGGLGIRAECADDRGNGLPNGTLVEAAVQAGFRCILTRDRLFSESASRALKPFPTFCVVLVTIPQVRGPSSWSISAAHGA